MRVTFYGQDFSPIAKAKVKGLEEKKEPLKEKIDDGLTYGELLNQFVEKYEIHTKKSTDSLYFPANNDLFGRWVGVFRNKKFIEEKTKKEFDVTLEISCRFDEGKDAYFLAAMLLCLKPKALEHPYDVNITSFHQVMDIFLLFMYKKQLVEAAKKGIFRKYQRFENNDSRPHGTIDIARHIRENMGLERGSIAYHYRELTANNPVNRLILAAYRRLCEKFPTLCEEHLNQDESVSSTLNILRTELGYSKTNVRNIVKENLRPIAHPYFSEYEILRKTCLKILRGENVSIFDADCSEETEALYEDVTELWERFLTSRIEKQLEEMPSSGLSLTTQGINGQKIPIFAGWERNNKRKNKFSKPDFVFWQGERRDRAIAVLDAKFKPSWDEFFCGTLPSPKDAPGANKDIVDDINKCIRDMAVFHARRTGVIFPVKNEDDPNPENYPIGISDDMFDMVRVPVIPPPEQGTGFEAWYKTLKSAVDLVLSDYLSVVSG